MGGDGQGRESIGDTYHAHGLQPPPPGGLADLHLHTTASDGSHAPAEVVRLAAAEGLRAVAVTDHDTTDGVAAAEEAGTAAGVEVIAGVEISTETGDRQVHILGYLYERDDEELQELLDWMRRGRRRRAQEMVRLLQQEGIEVSFDTVETLAGDGAIGRPHVARALLEAGVVATVSEAFERYIGTDGPAYVPRPRLSPAQAVRGIRRAGGVPVLAHPGLTGDDALIPPLVDAGLMGLEVRHSNHSPVQVRRYRRLADELDLLPTGGSDCHGAAVKGRRLMGTVHVPYQWAVKLQEAAS